MRGRKAWLATAGTLALASAVAGQACAADPDSHPPAQRSAVSEVVVTATRVKRPDFVAPTPTVALTSEDIQKLGAANIGDITQAIPAFQPTNTPTTSVNSMDAGRGNFLDLRGLGPGRTLVLVDGQRFVPTTLDGLLDTDVIPAAIIDRLDVVTGGASASWGSDAVAGVVNVILKKNLTGLEGDFQGGESQYGDNRNWNASLAWGSDFADGQGHVEIAGEATDNSGVAHQADRPWSNRQWGIVSTPQFNFVTVPNARLSIATGGGLILSGPLAGTQFGPGASLQPFNFGTNVGSLYMQGGDGFGGLGENLALEVPLRRQSVLARTSYQVTPDIEVFADVSYAHAITNNPTFAFNGDLVDTISTDNAFLPAALKAAYAAAGQNNFILGRIDTDFGFIGSKDETDVARVVVGADGKLGSKWTWNAYYEYGWVRHFNDTSNILNEANYALALDSVIGPGGTPVCRSTLTDPTNGCTPINIFGSGSPSPAALAYVLGNETTLVHNTQNVISGSLQGEPFSDWAGPVSVAAGAEWRRDTVNSAVDPVQEAGNFFFGNGKSFVAAENVAEGFVETVVPLLSDVPLVHRFDVDLAARYTNYSISGSVTTWKAGFTWTVTDELKFRGTRSRDIRAPTVSELFQTGNLSFADVTDPATGATVVIANPSPANPHLKPEMADTWTAGVVFQPRWADGLNLTVDFYDIDLKSVIASLNPQDVVNRCAAGNASLCSLITRDAAGDITQVQTPLLNLQEFRTRGVDLEAIYHVDLARVVESWPGAVTFRALANYVDLFSTNDGVTTVDEAGAVGSINLPSNVGAVFGVPHWRGNLSATYDEGPLTLYLEGRYVGGGKLDNLYGPADVPNNSSPSRAYMNASVQYTLVNHDGRRLQLYATMNNVFNQAPPIIVDHFVVPLATNPFLYDVIGRTWSIGVRFHY